MRKLNGLIGLALWPLLASAATPAAAAEARYVITNGGADVTDSGHVLFFPAGHRDQSNVGSGHSGDPVQLPDGKYDVHLLFSDGYASKDVWLADQTVTGKVAKSYEMALKIADVRVVITNGGADVTDSGHVLFYPAGRRDGATAATGHSGDSVRIPAGAYDVHLLFSDGSAHGDVWLSNQNFAGKVQKSVELGVAVAELRVVVVNGGADVGANGHVQVFPAGHRDGGNVASGHSGDSMRLPAGAYDVEAWFSAGMIDKHVWLAGLKVAGKLERRIELGLNTAEPTVKVTQNGVDVGDKAGVAFIDPASHAEKGAVRSGEAALLEAGTYDVHASLFGAEGWLRGAALSGKPRLTIEVKPLKTEQLRVGGPPPAACAIEVYGVNFDFNKAVLRPDSEPMLKQILALFAAAPGFSAEIGGHTDNIGKADYNLKLSDARAAAVKAWLLARGVAAARVASHGYGDTRPLVPNTTDANRFKNRRVELRTANCR
jgi:outer membrane protein OmpA-like peptidoglycan-associated protein